MEKLREEYATQDNRCTAYPIYVTVQELQFVAVLDERCNKTSWIKE